MSKIRVMSETLANKIAAGEIVERISSVVKELVENSIDAKSKKIIIDLIDAGKKSITVIDDGIGMDKDDAKTSFQRHATSKIYKDDDLFFINTLGFRGEALPSIASVSEVILETYNGVEGTKVHIKGGEYLSVTSCESRPGTKITVTNLFYNTPARLKYLKSENSELGSVIYYLEKLALSMPDISITLNNNGNKVLFTSGSGDLLKTIHEIYGLDVSSNMIPIKKIGDDYQVSGYISKPQVLRSNKNHMTTLINGRVIKNIDINKMINEGYYTYKPETLYPIVVINIETDPTLVDVNIHPTKQDVKLSKISELSDTLVTAIKDALYNNMLIPTAIGNGNKDDEEDEILESSLPSTLFVHEDASNTYSLNSFERKKDSDEVQLNINFLDDDKNEAVKKLELYLVGIAHGTYIICENDEGIFMIDQHAAQERVNYEKVLKGIVTKNSEQLLVPMTIELSKSEFEIVKNNIKHLEDIGFDLEEFGINTYKINAHPTWVKKGNEIDTVRAVIDTLVENNGEFDEVRFNDRVAATVACKASIKGNMRITHDEANFLLNELCLCDNPYNCPHGRPTIIKFTKYEIEKMFKRVM